MLFTDKEGFETAVRTAAQMLTSSGTITLRGRGEGMSLVKQAIQLLQLHLRGVTNFLLSSNTHEVCRQLSLPINPHNGPAAVYKEILQDLDDLLEAERTEGNEVEQSTEVVVGEDATEAATQAFRVLSSTGKVILSGLDADIPNVALVLEQVKAKFLQPPETISTKVSITIALPGYQSSSPAAQPEEHNSDSDASSSEEEEEDIKPRPQYRGQSKYIRLAPPPLSSYPVPGEFYITIRKPVKFYIIEAIQWLQSACHTQVVLKGIGLAVGHTVFVAEKIKRVIPGLHQITSYGKMAFADTYEPIEWGLDTVRIDRHIASLDICLSLCPLDSSNPGYQPPLSSDLVVQ